MEQSQLISLLRARIKGELSIEEKAKLDAILQDANQKEMVIHAFSQIIEEQPHDEHLQVHFLEPLLENALSIDRPNAKRTSLFSISWLRYTAAAVIILAIGSGIYYLSNQSYKSQQSNQSQFRQLTQDIAPGTNRAILTINNNQSIDLATNKTAININNTITYSDGQKIADAGQLLQLTTPRGGQYQAVLPDGSKVWLNAASSIKFPSKFSDKERRVEVTGEVYFEIAKKLNTPFRISTGNTTIQVLGTSFNISAYPDEESQRTTLISGSVRVVANNQSAILQPGQQASIPIIPITKIKQITVQTTDIEQVMAWKKGIFQFNGANIPTVMRQLARWYDVEVVYEGNIPSREFQGKIPMNVSLSSALKVLEFMDVRFTLEGKKLIVYE